jgi:hypothetical protein
MTAARLVGVVMWVVGSSACSYPPLPQLDGGMSAVDGMPDDAAVDGMPADAAVDGMPADGGADGCSMVIYCHLPGTRCVQRGCSLVDAQNECKREMRTFCGTPACPFIFATGDQEITLNCDGASCGADTVACNGQCCASGVTACDSDGACL